MCDRRLAGGAAVLAILSAAAMIVEPAVASAQSMPYANTGDGLPPPAYQAPPPPQPEAPPPPPQGQYAPQQGQYGPPQGQYATPPPPQSEQPASNWAYAQNYDAYRAQYGQWAAQNCITQHSNNIAAGAIIGGVAGVLLAGSIAGWAARGAWWLLGGSLGLTAGALIGASSSAPGCPTGYAVRTGAPPFYYGGPAYTYGGYAPPAYAPAPYYRSGYGGWVWNGYRWVRRPAPFARPYAPY